MEDPGINVEFKAGGIKGFYPDSINPPVSAGVLNLSSEWGLYSIDLSGKDFSNVIGGFCMVINRGQNPGGATIYLDDIRYE